MRDFTALLALPASILSIVAVRAQDLPWPHNLPRTLKYYPEHEAHMKREAEVQERLAWQAPARVAKMMDHEGEKFFLRNWGFGEHTARWNGMDDTRSHAPVRDEHYSNVSGSPFLLPAIAPHSNYDTSDAYLFRRNIFERNFQCPSGTKSCSSIGHDYLCCNLDETCVETSKGVGCCPAGSSCGDDVAGCDTAAGYTSCPNSPNGGCCVPNAVCEGVGCVFRGTQTVTRTLVAPTLTSGASFTTETTSGRVITVAVATTEISVTTRTVTLSPSGYTTTQTIIVSPASSTTARGLNCNAGFFSCPASLGGGCCPNGQACGSDSSCPDITTSVTARPPVLPTSVSNSPSTTTVVGCPTGFYMCSARYLGGCCRVGRDCQTTSCPPQDTTTLVSSGVTVVVTNGGNAVTTGSCANGWFFCGADGGGGCCPSNYVCGRVSCTATNQGQQNTLKMPPSSANVLSWAWSFLALGVIAGAGMLWM